ncbi:MAG: DNA-processing protein DprA [Bacteroidales bacterium]|nr:DNA-processing protein DprA [Bacteroidales bacterium]
MKTETIYQIALTLIPGVGDINGKRLIAAYGSAEALFHEKRKSLEKIGGMRDATIEALSNPKEFLKRAEQEMAFTEKNTIRPLSYQDKDYPRRLLQCDDSPLMLYYKGNVNLNASRVVAIVGTRNVTEYGRERCIQLVNDLVGEQVLVISGLAYGVDTIAHLTAVQAGLPTVGVMGNGMQQIYPSANRKLAVEMLQNGGLLTECMNGTLPDRENFPRRNRIIAGMADAVIVVESALKGGSLITADLANSYNRDVFAFPGRVTDLYSQGCNHLIRTNQAHLMEDVNNLRYVMRWEQPESVKERQTTLFREYTEEEQRIMDCFEGQAVVNLDDLIVKTGLATTKLAALLLNLEFDGIVTALPGKRYQRC